MAAPDSPVSDLGPEDWNRNFPVSRQTSVASHVSRQTSVASYAGMPTRYQDAAPPPQQRSTGRTQFEQAQGLEEAALAADFFRQEALDRTNPAQSQPYPPQQPSRTQPTPTQPAPEQPLTPAQQRARDLENAHRASRGLGTPEQERQRAQALMNRAAGGGQPRNGAAAHVQNYSPGRASGHTTAQPQYTPWLRLAQQQNAQRNQAQQQGRR
ncbi:hypothetical protein ACWGJ2_01460 [Streptomyces sp. NPDC054796]